MHTHRLANKLYLLVFGIVVICCLLAGYAMAATKSKDPANTPPGSTLEQRIVQRKKERQTRLNSSDKERLEGTCVTAQSKLRTMNDSYTNSAGNRDKTYRSIDAKLWIIIGSLKLISKDTFKLEQHRLAYIKRVQVYENQAAQFQQTIKDLAAMNCQADPVGFKALLDTARLYNAQVRSSFISIKSYLIDQVQPSITDQSNDLKLKTTTE